MSIGYDVCPIISTTGSEIYWYCIDKEKAKEFMEDEIKNDECD